MRQREFPALRVDCEARNRLALLIAHNEPRAVGEQLEVPRALAARGLVPEQLERRGRGLECKDGEQPRRRTTLCRIQEATVGVQRDVAAAAVVAAIRRDSRGQRGHGLMLDEPTCGHVKMRHSDAAGELVVHKEHRACGVPARVAAPGLGGQAQVARVVGRSTQRATPRVKAVHEDGREAEVARDDPLIRRMHKHAVAVRSLLPVVQRLVDLVGALMVL